MPKVHNTRRQRAAELLRRLEEGPAFSSSLFNEAFTKATAADDYRIWVTSWVIPVVKQPVPELKERK